jgi:sodium/potassium-transporting ATPase subunit alpha
VRQLKKSNVLVKNMGCFEASSRMSVLATDKTGTITKNNLAVTDVLYGCDKGVTASECFYDLESQLFTGVEAGVLQVLATCYLCNSHRQATEKTQATRNALDEALGSFAEQSFQHEKVHACYAEAAVQEIEFTSSNKFQVKMFRPPSHATDPHAGMHSLLYGREHAGEHVVLVKGAPDLLRFKSRWIIDTAGKRRLLTQVEMEKVSAVQDSWCAVGKRVVMLCKKYVSEEQAAAITDFDKFFKSECNDLIIIG